MSLYNLHSADGQWKITKFSNDLEVESSYITSLSECECPAGNRPSCRHRQMLPKLLEVGAEDSGLFYDFDKDQFFEPIVSEANESSSNPPPIDTVLETVYPVPIAELPPSPAEPIETVSCGTPHPTIGHIKRRI